MLAATRSCEKRDWPSRRLSRGSVALPADTSVSTQWNRFWPLGLQDCENPFQLFPPPRRTEALPLLWAAFSLSPTLYFALVHLANLTFWPSRVAAWVGEEKRPGKLELDWCHEELAFCPRVWQVLKVDSFPYLHFCRFFRDLPSPPASAHPNGRWSLTCTFS